MEETSIDKSLEHTSHNDVEQLMIKAEEDQEAAKKQEEQDAIFEANINKFNAAMADTLKEIMDGDINGAS